MKKIIKNAQSHWYDDEISREIDQVITDVNGDIKKVIEHLPSDWTIDQISSRIDKIRSKIIFTEEKNLFTVEFLFLLPCDDVAYNNLTKLLKDNYNDPINSIITYCTLENEGLCYNCEHEYALIIVNFLSKTIKQICDKK